VFVTKVREKQNLYKPPSSEAACMFYRLQWGYNIDRTADP